MHSLRTSLTNLTAAIAGLVLGVLLLFLLAGCADVPRWGAWSKTPTREQLDAGMRRLSTYAYFPRYQVYFSAARSEYTYWDGRAWIRRSEPPAGLPVELLALSPAVTVHFDDEPERHHAEVSRLFPGDSAHSGTALAWLK